MRLTLVLAAATLALAAGAAQGETPAAPQPMPQRVSGTVKALPPGHLLLTTASGEVDLLVTPQTRVLTRTAASAAEIAAGSYLGSANVTTAEGGQATEVHLMADGPNVHSTMDANAGLMMTNGHVTSVQTTAKGREIDVNYGTGARRIVVAADTPVTRMVASDLSSLKVGAAVTAILKPGEGPPTANYITFTPPAP